MSKPMTFQKEKSSRTINSPRRLGWGGRIRTYECSSQSAVSYRLTTPQFIKLKRKPFCHRQKGFSGVDNGIRTHGLQRHNLAR